MKDINLEIPIKENVNEELTGQTITGETIPPILPEIFIDEHRGEYLILNPLGPWWFVGSRLHADFVRLCDGKKTLHDIRESLSSNHNGLTDEHMIRIMQLLQKANFFTQTFKQEIRLLNIVFFNVTKRCNLNCPYCYYDCGPVKKQDIEEELDAGTWIKLAGEIAKINPKAKIIISGGEPLIRPDIVDIITGISRHDLEIKILTNGTLFTKDMIAKLSKINKFSVQVSIDSILPEINDQSRGKGSLEKSLSAVLQLKEAGLDVEISATITQINYKYIRQFREYCDKNQLKLRSSIFMLSGEKTKTNAGWLELNPEEYYDASTYVLDFNDPNTPMEQAMTPGERRYSCGLGYGQVDISPDGSVSPCTHLNIPKFRIGNIKTSELRQLVEAGYKRYRPIDVDTMNPCSSTKCPVRYFCAGGCRAIALHHYGSLDVPAKYCHELKQVYITSLWASVVGPAFIKDKER
ncbi:MAG TPA: radical SAM protein [Candidatus Deferrimicrobium sp.]|nr:radical SAM protein [Candidatus Deferrimicrobium sp.]